jgi:hypothetical protein
MKERAFVFSFQETDTCLVVCIARSAVFVACIHCSAVAIATESVEKKRRHEQRPTRTFLHTCSCVHVRNECAASFTSCTFLRSVGTVQSSSKW